MTIKQNTFESGLAAGTGILTTNSGYPDAFSAVALGGGTLNYDNAQAMHGTLSAKLSPVASGAGPFVYWSGLTTNTVGTRFYVYATALATDDEWLIKVGTSAAATMLLAKWNPAGALRMQDNSGTKFTATSTFPLNQWVRVELTCDITNNLGRLAYYLGDSTTPVSGGDSGSIAISSGTTQVGVVQFGRINGGAYATPFWMDDIKYSDTSAALLGPATPLAAPVAAFASTVTGLSVAFDGSASTPVSGDTITSYSWNFGDSTTGTGVGPTHAYSTSGTKTVVLTVTDSNGQTNSITHTVAVTAPASSTGPVALVTTTGFTGSPDILTAISDADPTTFAVSGVSPSAGVFRVTLGPLSTPAAGTDMTVTVELDATGASTASASAALYEGSTVRATSAAQNLPVVASGSAMANTVTFTFAAASIANVANWNAVDLQVAVTAN